MEIEEPVFSPNTDDPVETDASPAAGKILSLDSLLAQALELTSCLKNLKEDGDLRKLFHSLGVAKTADLISAVVEPVTYQKCKKHVDVTDQVETLISVLPVLQDDSDLLRLVKKWSEAEHLNTYIASEIFAKSAAECAIHFAKAASTHCLSMTSDDGGACPTPAVKANAKSLAAAACHVLVDVPEANVMSFFVLLLQENAYDRFIALAIGGERELPLLVDVAVDHNLVNDSTDHHEFGKVTLLLEIARNAFKNRLCEVPVMIMNEEQLVQEYMRVLGDLNVSASRVADVEADIIRRGETHTVSNMGLAHFYQDGRGLNPNFPANAILTPELTESILRSVTKGEPPFELDVAVARQQDSRGWWFISKDETCYVREDGTTVDVISIPVEIGDKPHFVISKTELCEMFEECRPRAVKMVESRYRLRLGLSEGDVLEGNSFDLLSTAADFLTETYVWDSVRDKVASSSEGIAVVDIDAERFYGQMFGREFIVVRDPTDVHVRDGVPTMVATLRKLGMEAEPYLLEAAKCLLEALKESGRISAVFRVGGRVILVLSIAKDTYKIMTARNKLKASVETVGGWAGAMATAGTFAHFFMPVHIMGPLGCVAHGVGTVLAGGIGYWIGSSTCHWVYELAVVDDTKEKQLKSNAERS